MRDPVQRFVDVQARLLAANGTVATSRYLSLPTPALQAHVLDAGSGPPLLLIHGGNSVAVAWQPLLGDLARAFHVFAPDRPGCGLTDKVDYRGVDLRQHAVDFIASTLDALGLDRVHLVG